MNDRQKFALCLEAARRIVSSRRSQAPCDPLAYGSEAGLIIGIVSVAAAAAGTAVSVASAQSSAKASEDTANYNKQVAENNATAATQQGQSDAQKIQYKGKKLLGQEQAAEAKSGLSGGSGADVMYDSSIQSELDSLTTVYKASVEGSNYTSQATLYGMQATNAGTAGTYATIGSALTGVGKVSSGSSSLLKSASSNNDQPTLDY